MDIHWTRHQVRTGAETELAPLDVGFIDLKPPADNLRMLTAILKEQSISTQRLSWILYISQIRSNGLITIIWVARGVRKMGKNQVFGFGIEGNCITLWLEPKDQPAMLSFNWS
jgi:hypothetical protein